MKPTQRRGARTPSAAMGLANRRLRRLCGAWDGVEEGLSFGHPTFRVRGKPFAVLDRYHEHDCLWLKVPAEERAELLRSEGWFASPYDPRLTALCVRLEAIDWRRIGARLRISYALAAPVRAVRRPAGR